MINRLCKRLNQNIEVRQSLSSLRQEIKDSSKRELLLSWIHDGDLDLSVFLENEDAKTRKNAALFKEQHLLFHLPVDNLQILSSYPDTLCILPPLLRCRSCYHINHIVFLS